MGNAGKGFNADRLRSNGKLLQVFFALISCDEELLRVVETFLLGLLRPLHAPLGTPLPRFPLALGGGGGGGIYGGNAADTEGEDGSGLVLSSVFCGSQEEEERRGWYDNWLEEKRESTFSVESPSESDAWHGTGECKGLGLDMVDLFFNFSIDDCSIF